MLDISLNQDVGKVNKTVFQQLLNLKISKEKTGIRRNCGENKSRDLS